MPLPFTTNHPCEMYCSLKFAHLIHTLSAPGTLYAGENFMLRFRFPARHSFANLSKFKRCFCHGCETYLGKLCQLISLDLGKHQPGYPFESPEAILQRQSLQRFGQHVSKFVGKC